MPWDVFVSHASEDKVQVADPLVVALQQAGLSVWYDTHSLRLGDSLRRSIDEGLSKSRFGVIVLSPSFFKKEWPQKELDALVVRERDGKKVVLPVWFNTTVDEVRTRSPLLADRVAVQWSDGLQTVVASIVQAVQGSSVSIKSDARDATSGNDSVGDLEKLILISPDTGGPAILRCERLEESDSLELVIASTNPSETAFLSALRSPANRVIGIAFGTTGLLARVSRVQRIRESGREEWVLSLSPQQSDYGAGSLEMGTHGYSADRIAELRARRILLNEPGEAQGASATPLLEALIRGINTPLRVEKSPFPAVFEHDRANPAHFIAAARLFAVLWLRLSGCIESVLQLDLNLVEDNKMWVHFKGQRPKKYTNVQATVISIDGACPLVVT